MIILSDKLFSCDIGHSPKKISCHGNATTRLQGGNSDMHLGSACEVDVSLPSGGTLGENPLSKIINHLLQITQRHLGKYNTSTDSQMRLACVRTFTMQKKFVKWGNSKTHDDPSENLPNSSAAELYQKQTYGRQSIGRPRLWLGGSCICPLVRTCLRQMMIAAEWHRRKIRQGREPQRNRAAYLRIVPAPEHSCTFRPDTVKQIWWSFDMCFLLGLNIAQHSPA